MIADMLTPVELDAATPDVCSVCGEPATCWYNHTRLCVRHWQEVHPHISTGGGAMDEGLPEPAPAVCHSCGDPESPTLRMSGVVKGTGICEECWGGMNVRDLAPWERR